MIIILIVKIFDNKNNFEGVFIMADFVIIAESTADLSPSVIKELGIDIIPMHFLYRNNKMRDYPDHRELSIDKLYESLSNGEVITTSAINLGDITEAVEPYLKDGKDVLYPAFSSALSTTYNNALMAREELLQKYPDRKFIVIDTKSACLGQGLLLYYAVMKKRKGFSIEETAAWLEENKNYLNHWFTLDDLMFLKRSGRLSATSAILGTAFGIKPVLHVDGEGRLVPVSKSRGRKQALAALVKMMEKHGKDINNQVVFISHANAFKDAKTLETMVLEKFKPKKIYINTIGPVIGSHSGPGTIALFFMGDSKDEI